MLEYVNCTTSHRRLEHLTAAAKDEYVHKHPWGERDREHDIEAWFAQLSEFPYQRGLRVAQANVSWRLIRLEASEDFIFTVQ